jgi:signal transduction histidine kinase
MVWPRRLATAASLVTGALLVAAVSLAAAAPARGSLGFLALGLAVAPAAAVLGLLVVRRQPGNVVGALLPLVGLTVAFFVTRQVAWYALAERPQLLRRLAWLVAWLSETPWWTFVAVALLLLYFPDGRLPGRRWRWVPPVMVGGVAIVTVYGAFESGAFDPPLQRLPRPNGPPPLWFSVLEVPAFFVMLALVLACAASLVVRYRRAGPVQRTQIRWLALAGSAIPLYPPLCLVEIALFGHPFWISQMVLVAALVGIPVATGIAVLRHDLYDVDKALAGAVTWGLLTVLLLGIYALGSVTVGLLLGRDSAVAAAAATAMCALALSPLHARVRRVVDRRLYPLRRAALAAIEALQREVNAGRARPEGLQPVLRGALRDPALRVGFHVPGTEGFVDADGGAVHPGNGAPVVLGTARIGILVPGQGMASAELLRQVATWCGSLVEVVRLRLELAGALREVESSRARLVQTGLAERRRLERDLHDGAQQRLVSLGMAIRLAQRHLGDGTVDVNGLLDESIAELATAVAELRLIARGLRPVSLDNGLPTALAALVRTVPIAVDMDICADPLPDDVATTAYYVVSEAVANAVKHAEAERIGLRVARVNGHVLVTVTDDGRGGASLHPGSGLADRVAALGGNLRVDSPAGHGTTVEVALPCAS